MFEKVKRALRMTNDDLDEDIKLAINSALLELGRVGVDTTGDNELITTGAILYCWFYFNFHNDGERYKAAFDVLRDSLSVSGAYSCGGASNE